MKIFEFNINGVRGWVAAPSILLAVQEFCAHEEMDVSEFQDGDEVVELPEDKWDEYRVISESADDETDHFSETFRQVVARLERSGMIARHDNVDHDKVDFFMEWLTERSATIPIPNDLPSAETILKNGLLNITDKPVTPLDGTKKAT